MEYDNSSFDYYGSGTEIEEDDICNFDPKSEEITIQIYVHSFICAFGFLGNMLVVVTYMFYKRTKTMTDVYLLNVAVADILFVVALPLIIYNEQHDWAMGSVACKLLQGAYSVNLFSGMLLLACISGDRYIAIVQARRFYGVRSRSLIYSRLICSAVWVVAVALSIPTVVYTERYVEDNPFNETDTVMCQFHFSHSDTARLMKILVPSLQVSIGFFLPLVVMGFCYSSITHTLLKAQSTQRHKAIRVVLAVVVVFIICHLPYNVCLLTCTLSLFKQRSCKEEKLKLKALAITKSVAYLHCSLNPILYAFVGEKFRNHFCGILQDLWCLGKRVILYGRSSRQTSDLYISSRKSTEGTNNENGSSFTV